MPSLPSLVVTLFLMVAVFASVTSSVVLVNWVRGKGVSLRDHNLPQYGVAAFTRLTLCLAFFFLLLLTKEPLQRWLTNITADDGSPTTASTPQPERSPR